VRRYLDDPVRVADRIFMSCGLFEALIDDNRAVRPVLASTEAQVLLAEMHDGHTGGCWRDTLGIGLPWLFADAFRPRDVRPFERPDGIETEPRNEGEPHG